MGYVPFAPEIGAKYTLTAGDGTVATFNDSTDGNFSGYLTEVTGLDSPDVRESGDTLVQADGGWHGNFYYGRRPITLSGNVVNIIDAADRAAKIDRISRASNAMRADAVLSWQNTAAGSVPMQTWVRRQQPVRYSSGWAKSFQLLLVSQFAPLFSVAQHSLGTNLVVNPNFETDASSWAATGTRLNAGATVTRVTSQHNTGVAALQVVTTNATTLEGATTSQNINVTNGVTYQVSAWVKGNAGGESVTLVAGDATVGTTTQNITLTTGWQQVSLTFVPTATGTTGLAIRTPGATAYTFFVDTVEMTKGSVVPPFAGNQTVIAENQGNWAVLPVAYIYGPTTGTVNITSVTTGQVFQALSGLTLSSGQWAAVDMLNHTVTRDNGTKLNQYIDFVNSTWPALITGNNTFTVANAPSMDLVWRDQWV
jgi:hypothetical protein